MADTECFRDHSTGCMSAEDRRRSMGKIRFSVKVKVAVKVSCWVVHVQETEQRLTVVHILALATCSVQNFNFRSGSQRLHRTLVTASQPLSTGIVAHTV